MQPVGQPIAPDEDFYQLVKRRESDPREVEESGASLVEVTVRWGRSVMHVAHLEQRQTFILASHPTPQRSALPSLLGGLAIGAMLVVIGAAHRNPWLAVIGSVVALIGGALAIAIDHHNQAARTDGTRFIVDDEVLGGADALRIIDRVNGKPTFLFDGTNDGGTESNRITQRQHAPTILAADQQCFVEVGALIISARLVPPARRVARGRRLDAPTVWAALGAIVAMATLLTAVRLTTTEVPSLFEDEFRDTTIHELERFISYARDHAPMERRREDPRAVDQSSALGQTHHEAAGTMGRPDSAQRDRHYTLANRDAVPQLARLSARDLVAQRGVFAALGSAASVANAEGPASPFGDMRESGRDSVTFTGNMTADLAGTAFGYSGLGRGGIGFGGGGAGEGTIGTSPLGFIGAGRGACGCGEGMNGSGAIGFGRLGTLGRLLPEHHTPPAPVTLGPMLRCGDATCAASNEGFLSADDIRRVVLRNLGQVRHCHEQGLQQDPGLAGRVAVRFVIGANGDVMGAAVADSSLAVSSVSECIAHAVSRWTFPSPVGGGIVTVTYPFVLHAAE